MPIYEFACTEHGRFDDLVPMGQMTHACPQCSQQSVKLVSMPAKTATLWNSRWNEGLSSTGFHSYSVGGQVCDKRQEEEIMKKRGFISEQIQINSWPIAIIVFFARLIDQSTLRMSPEIEQAIQWT